jgi:hypothetical protein
LTGLQKCPYDSPRLGKRKRALWGHNPPRNTQAFADAMGRGVRANTMFDPGPTTVTHEVSLAGWALIAGCALEENTPLPPHPGNIAEAMSCLEKSRGNWGQSPQRHHEGGEAAAASPSPRRA